MQQIHYVYILVSEHDPSHYYTGLTTNFENRLKAHNTGQSPHTSKFRPWRIETAVAFFSSVKAAAFEKYLKSHSGRAFATNIVKQPILLAKARSEGFRAVAHRA
jgi:putative endonuclease